MVQKTLSWLLSWFLARPAAAPVFVEREPGGVHRAIPAEKIWDYSRN